jgi:hypothetical protein
MPVGLGVPELIQEYSAVTRRAFAFNIGPNLKPLFGQEAPPGKHALSKPVDFANILSLGNCAWGWIVGPSPADTLPLAGGRSHTVPGDSLAAR